MQIQKINTDVTYSNSIIDWYQNDEYIDEIVLNRPIKEISSVINKMIDAIEINSNIVPQQAGNANKFLSTNGSNTIWKDIDIIPDQTNNANKVLSTDGSNLVWTVEHNTLPDQTGNSNKYLSTNGEIPIWKDIDIIPDQTNNANKVLSTDGSNLVWTTMASASGELPIQENNTGKYLRTDGINAYWDEFNGVTSFNGYTGDISFNAYMKDTTIIEFSSFISNQDLNNNAHVNLSYNDGGIYITSTDNQPKKLSSTGGYKINFTLDGSNGTANATDTEIYINEDGTPSLIFETGELNITSVNGITPVNGTIIKIIRIGDVIDNFPDQTNNANKVLSTDGNSPFWKEEVSIPAVDSSTNNKILSNDGLQTLWISNNPFPNQSGKSGKFLQTNGTSISWASIPSIPSQSGNSGKVLTTNGSSSYWKSYGIDDVLSRGNTTSRDMSINKLTANEIEFGSTGIKEIESGSNIVLNAANGSGYIDVKYSQIKYVGMPTDYYDVATKGYVDSAVSNASSSSSSAESTDVNEVYLPVSILKDLVNNSNNFDEFREKVNKL